MNLASKKKMIEVAIEICEKNAEGALKIAFKECLEMVDDLSKERNRRYVVTHEDMDRRSTVLVLEALTLIDAMNEVGVPFRDRHTNKDLVFSRCYMSKRNFRVTEYTPCGCSHDCCGHIFQADYVFGKVGNSWICEITLLRNY